MKRLIAVITIVTTLSLGIVRPKPAHATSTGEAIGIAAVCIVVYVGIVLIATKLVYGAQDNGQTTAEDPETTYRKAPHGVQPANHCTQEGGNLTVACW